ncbi:TPA: tyrosine protein kinase [Enterococcus faecium]|nr:tyrosine protein kinase [Enterococcus faecium]
MEETISLKEIFETLRKHLVTIIISMFAGLAISGIVTFFILTPKYSSQAQLIVTLPQSDTANVNDVNTNLQMINTYKDMIVSDLVLNEVKDRLETEDNVKMTAEQIKEAISVNQSQNSQMFSIQAISTNAVTAQQIANTTSQVFQENAKDVMNVDKISIISGAVAKRHPTPVSPNNKLNLVIGLVLGMMVGVGLAFLFELLDRTVKDEKYVTDTLGFPILGTVPEMSAKELNAGIRKKGSAPARPKATNGKTAPSRRSRSRV